MLLVYLWQKLQVDHILLYGTFNLAEPKLIIIMHRLSGEFTLILDRFPLKVRLFGHLYHELGTA